MRRVLRSAGILGSLLVALEAGQAGAQSLDAGAVSPESGESPDEPATASPDASTPPNPTPTTPTPEATPDTSAVAGAIEAQVAAAEAALRRQSMSSPSVGEQLEQRRLDLYGFADFTYSNFLQSQGTATPSTSTFGVGNLNLYLASELGDEWRSLVEVRFMYLPNGGQTDPSLLGPRTDTTIADPNDFGRPIQWGGISIQRAWLERTFHKLLTVRVGHWLTPYGIWNVDHGSPVVIGIGRPFIVGEALFPSSQTGVEIYGATDFDALQLGYHLTLSNGRGPTSTTQDIDNNKAVGGRLFLRHESRFGTLHLGTAFYRGRYSDKHSELGVDGTGATALVYVIDSEYDELSLSADLKWQLGGLQVQGEVIENEVAYTPAGRTVSKALGVAAAFDSDYRRWGAYGQSGYRFAFLGAMPYLGAGYYKEGSASFIPKLMDLWVGLNLRPTPRVVLKLQYTFVRFYFGPSTMDWKILAAQTAWSF
jgi:hypothetical protein